MRLIDADALQKEYMYEHDGKRLMLIDVAPTIEPTLYGYPVEHLMLIAYVLRKENLPPERVFEAVADIGRIVSMVRDEFEEVLRKSVEQCMMEGR